MMVPSSSGPGHLVLIQKIAGSTPAGITMKVMNARYEIKRPSADGLLCVFRKLNRPDLRLDRFGSVIVDIHDDIAHTTGFIELHYCGRD